MLFSRWRTVSLRDEVIYTSHRADTCAKTKVSWILASHVVTYSGGFSYQHTSSWYESRHSDICWNWSWEGNGTGGRPWGHDECCVCIMCAHKPARTSHSILGKEYQVSDRAISTVITQYPWGIGSRTPRIPNPWMLAQVHHIKWHSICT